MVSILSAKTKLQISKTKDPIAREYTDAFSLGKYHQKKSDEGGSPHHFNNSGGFNPYLIKVIVWVPTHFSFTHN